MVVHSEVTKTATRARAMEQLGREGPVESAINTIKHAPRQGYGLIWISFVQIIDPDFAPLLVFGSVASRNPCRGRAAERLKGRPAQIDEYCRYRFNNLAYRSIRFEPEVSEKHVSFVGRLATCRDYYNIGMALAEFERLQIATG